MKRVKTFKIKSPKCIFCLTSDKKVFNTKEHILPESLGGDDWAILPEGLYCDSCQNKFGSSIEQQALADYPFVMMRTILGIPTKKKRAAWFKYPEGILSSGSKTGRIIYEPNDFFSESFKSGQKIFTIVPSTPKRPEMILRMLIKIGLEVIAANDQDEVFEKRFNPAREFALTGLKTCQWFYVQKEDDKMKQRYMKGKGWRDHHCFMDVNHDNDGMVYLHMRTFYLEFMTPLLENVVLDPDNKFEGPGETVFFV